MAGEQLRVTQGNARGKSLTVDAELILGRAAAVEEGRLGDDPATSRRHARISRTPGGELTIEDLGSAYGTFVNGERVDGPRTLRAGDTVKLGDTVLEVSKGSDAAAQRTQLRADVSAAKPDELAGAGKELVITSGSGKGRRLKLGDELVIGRGVSGAGGLSDDNELSRRHARVASDAGGRLTIEDLGSANGTFVNGVRVVEPHVLRVGDTVSVGGTTLELTDAGAVASRPEQATPPRPAHEPTPPAPAPEVTPPRPAPRAPAPRPQPPRPAAPRPDSPLVSAELTLGTVFAGCRVEDVVGSGDMGTVYRAEELALQRPVAVKVIRREHSQESRFRERFRRESMVAASIDHQNVIPIFDAGEEDGVLYLTMRLVVGTDLRALIAAEGGLDPRRAVRIVKQVAAALDAAHARGLLHRDVKPANVLLGRADHVYLSDFGLAKRAGSVGGLTRPGSIVARVEYVAPEQIKNDPIDARVDVYALGCLLFEALTGEAPFARLEGGQAMLAHLDTPVPRPSELRLGLPVQFDQVVLRAMAKRPDERYPSAGDLAQAALVIVGELEQPRAEAIVARGEAAPGGSAVEPGAARAQAAGSRTEATSGARRRGGSTVLRWGLALAFLALLAVAMIAALGALERL